MYRTRKCPKCKSERILEGLEITHEGSGMPLQVTAYENPKALFFKDKRTGRLKAWVCSTCGFTELYCPDLF